MSSRQVGSNTSALGRRRRCGNGAARVAEPAFATACSPREAFPSLPSAPWPPRGRERVRGAGRAARKAPRRGAARELEAARPARAAARRRGGAAWPGRVGAGAEERSGPPGERRARRPRGLAPAGERTPVVIARAQVILNTTCLTLSLATLASVFHCLQKIEIALEIGNTFDLKEITLTNGQYVYYKYTNK